MKILKLHIDQFRHLENLDFDFTYPEDFHIEEKRGKPLDKICFIGQSATGKTGLLEVLYDSIKYAQDLETLNNKYLSFKTKNVDVDFDLRIGNEYFSKKNKIVSYKGNQFEHQNVGGTLLPLIEYKNRRPLLFLKANLISDKNIDIFTKNPIDLFEKHSEQISVNIDNLLHNYNYDYSKIFSDEVDPKIWLFLINEILDYRKKFNQKMSDLIHKGLLANQKKLTFEFEKWQKDNPNTLEQFAEKFNPILDKLNLEVDVFNTEYSIPIKNKKNDEIIPIQNTSTGTKGLLLSFLPLYKLDTTESIILIDEPERSLYPDMQMDLMEYYQDLAKNAQFIIATHSPFIAASFEPEERFILYFDEEGKVAVRRGNSPIGDDPNDMLENDFGINYVNKFGQKKHKEYLELKQQIFFEKDESKKKKIAEKLEKLGEEYNF